MIRSPIERPRPFYEGPATWKWFIGATRIGLLFIAVAGSDLIGRDKGFGYLLLAVYTLAFITSLAYLLSLRRSQQPPLLTWAQMFVDFGVVAVTLSITGGPSSVFTFLLVIVILEAGMLLGLMQGFLFATMATIFVFFQTVRPVLSVWPKSGVDEAQMVYTFVVQGLALYLTAFVSGYWNNRFTRMQQFQHELLDSMSSGFLITDRQGIILAQNQAADQILGIPSGSALGRPAGQILRASSGEECPVLTALRAERDFSGYEFYAITGENRLTLLELRTSLIRDNWKRPGGLIAWFNDMTEVAQMRQELQRHDRMVLVGELAAGLAHEIRNPLASIRGAMDELRSSLERPELIKRLSTIALRESDHLNEIVTGFFEYTRDPVSRRALMDLRVVLEETVETLRHHFAECEDIQITLSLPDTPCHVLADGSQIHQVFTNLAVNGIEAMEHKGCLDVAIQVASGYYEIRFEDGGPGIEPDMLARVFEPFFTTKASGVGMGLAICLRLVTIHDGTIQAARLEKGGTAMIVRLPVATRQALAGETATESAGK